MFFDRCPKCSHQENFNTIVEKGSRAYLKCSNCGEEMLFNRQPLIVAIGPAGAGKRTLCMQMARMTQEVVCLDCDMLTREKLLPGGQDQKDIWLTIAAGVAQSGRAPMLFACGTAEDYLALENIKYFSPVYFIGICAQGPEIISRLRERQLGDNAAEYLSEMMRINNAVRTLPNVIDTSGKNGRTAAWELATLTHKLLNAAE